MKPYINLLTVLLLSLTFNATYADSPSSRPDSHAPIGVMGDHGHKTGEVMLSYRFMAMDMQGLQTRLDFAISSNLIVPSRNPLAGQRLAVEFQMPIYQNLTGTQLKNRWRLLLGWQYAFRL